MDLSSRSALRGRLLALTLGAALFVGAPAALAQDQASPPADNGAAGSSEQAEAPKKIDPMAVVATVGGENITEADLGFAAQDLAQELQRVPPDQQRPFLVSVLIDMKVMAEAARDAKMDQSDLFKQRMQYLADRTLRQQYFADQVNKTVNEAALKQAYDAYTKAFKPEEQVRAAHILVASKDEAEAIKKQLDAGADFAELAKSKSTDKASGAQGGELGFFTHNQMVKPFADAAFALKVGQISDPVQTQFGWHIIKLEEKKKTEPESFAQMQPQLQRELMFKTFDDTVERLKKSAAIDIPDAKLAAAVKAQEAQSSEGK